VIVRAARRAVTLAGALAICVVRYWWIRIQGPLSLEQRAIWLHDASRRVLSSLAIRSEVRGTPPSKGLVVSNHLSYLDIAIFSAAMPCFFVAKTEIDGWPYFGEAARVGGTMFIDRGSRASAEKVASEIAVRLPLPIPILVFPEGTSTDGSAVQRFHSRLIEPAVRAGASVTAAAIGYVLARGNERDLCWFGDEAFLPHLWKTLGTEGFTAVVQFGAPRTYPDRRAAARETQAEVDAMRNRRPALQ
jgi:lyso-ornithine lipid O-acyltransferase